ncbi:c-type cytochrome [Methylobacterium nigriterrae]|uniref:c-type cytochrome n=1 Tax=Methylobacterium nigriterrae TaxID=3127512 RepID=UPI003013F7EF
MRACLAVLTSLLALAGAPLAAAPAIEACTACHGAGTSQNPGVPSLGGMPATFVTNQLFMFREGQRRAEPMNGLAEPMSDDDLTAYATEIAKLPAPVYQGPAGDPARMARARELIGKHRCTSCHGPNLGGQDQIPRLRAQREEYLAAALKGYRSSDRAGFDPAMNEAAQDLNDTDIADLAYAIARQ